MHHAIQLSSVQFSSVQFSSVQFSSVQFSSAQFSSWRWPACAHHRTTKGLVFLSIESARVTGRELPARYTSFISFNWAPHWASQCAEVDRREPPGTHKPEGVKVWVSYAQPEAQIEVGRPPHAHAARRQAHDCHSRRAAPSRGSSQVQRVGERKAPAPQNRRRCRA